jgi:hypothetical protein
MADKQMRVVSHARPPLKAAQDLRDYLEDIERNTQEAFAIAIDLIDELEQFYDRNE